MSSKTRTEMPPFSCFLKLNSIQYMVVKDNIPVDRHVCEYTGGENDTNIIYGASIECDTIELAVRREYIIKTEIVGILQT